MSTVVAPDIAVPVTQRRRHTRHVCRLGTYDVPGDTHAAREIVSLRRPDGSVLVVDRLSDMLLDGRLVARLAPDEPSVECANRL